MEEPSPDPAAFLSVARERRESAGRPGTPMYGLNDDELDAVADAIEAKAALVAELVAVLRGVEGKVNQWRQCPTCKRFDAERHAPDCRLAAALASAGL